MFFRPYPWMTGFVLGALAVLYILGSWQYEKFARKTYNATEVSIPTDAIEGRVLPRPKIQLYGLIGGDPVWRQIQPIVTAEGEVVFAAIAVHEGTSPASLDTDSPFIGQIVLGGWLKPVEDIGWFGRLIAPSNQVENNIYHTKDIANWTLGLPQNLRPKVDNGHIFEPSGWRVGGASPPDNYKQNPYALPDADPLPPARHLGYAWTWWGLALVLIVIYFAYHRKEGRLGFRTTKS